MTWTDIVRRWRRFTIDVNPATLHDPSPNGYSVAVIAPPGARMAHISGQGRQDGTGALSPDFAVQVERAYANLHAAIDALGTTPDRVAKLTVFVVDHDMSKLGVLTQAVVRMFGATLPAQTLVPVPGLAVDGMLFEVEAVVILACPRCLVPAFDGLDRVCTDLVFLSSICR